MVEDTQVTPPPSFKETIPMPRYRHLEDTQPMPRVAPPPAPTPPPTDRGRGRGCFSCLFLVLNLLLPVIVGLAAAGYALWQLTANLPRTNILVLGLDRRPDQGTVVRADTMILMTAYPPGPRVVLLSIPRDLYVEIPGYGPNRINAAHFWGENEFEGGGPVLSMQTVEQNFGIPVHHYVRVDFDGFRAIVDAVGGIDLVVEQPIVDDAYPTEDYRTMRIEIPAGPQHMDGETALRYARSRHNSSDFDRAKRQQQVLIALVRRLLKPGVWPKLPAVYRVVMANVDTDLSLQDLLLLTPTLYRVGPDGIEHHVIGREMTDPWTTPAGGAVLRPRWEAINPMIQELFTP
jgi:LCP family protein required for cell wall assembly